MKMTASEGDTTITSDGLLGLPANPVPVPIVNMTGLQSIAMGFRLPHATGDDGVSENAGVSSGAGCGSPWIMLSWKGKHAGVHAVDLLAAWVRTWDPAEADSILAARHSHMDAAAVHVEHADE